MRTALALTLLLTSLAPAQEVEVEAPDRPSLPLGRVVEAELIRQAPARYEFVAEQPGVLFVAFRLDPGVSMFAEILDVAGQRPPGRSLAGRQAQQPKQYLAASLVTPGTYLLQLKTASEPTKVSFVARFAPFPAVAADRDLDASSPLEPHALVPGQPLDNQLGPVDAHDWFLLRVEEAGTLVVRVETRTESPHFLKLNTFQGVATHLTNVWPARWDAKAKVLRLEKVEAGQELYLKLELAVGSDRVPYTIRAEVESLLVEEED